MWLCFMPQSICESHTHSQTSFAIVLYFLFWFYYFILVYMSFSIFFRHQLMPTACKHNIWNVMHFVYMCAFFYTSLFHISMEIHLPTKHKWRHKIAHYFDILLLLKFINLILLYIFNVPINIFILFFISWFCHM